MLVKRVYLQPGMGLCVGWRVYFSTLGSGVGVGAVRVVAGVRGAVLGGVAPADGARVRARVGRGKVLPLGCAQVGVGGERLHIGGVQACQRLCV